MKRSIILLLAAFIAGCASTSRIGNVIPLEGDVYEVFTSADTKKVALESALYSTEATCEARRMRQVVPEQRTDTKGIAGESTNRAIDKTQEITVVTTGERFPTLSSEDDSDISMRFRYGCWTQDDAVDSGGLNAGS